MKQITTSSASRGAVGAVLLALLVAPVSGAGTSEWIGGAGAWNVAGNWRNGVPTAGDVARIPAGGPAVGAGTAAPCAALRISATGERDAWCMVDGGELSVETHLGVGGAGPGNFLLSAGFVKCDGWITVGSTGSGLWTQSGGSVEADQLLLANALNKDGTWKLSGGAVEADELIVGSLGNGLFAQTGGTVHVSKLTLAEGLLATGTYTLKRGTLCVTGSLHIGGKGHAVLGLDGRGTVKAQRLHMGSPLGTSSLLIDGLLAAANKPMVKVVDRMTVGDNASIVLDGTHAADGPILLDVTGELDFDALANNVNVHLGRKARVRCGKVTNAQGDLRGKGKFEPAAAPIGAAGPFFTGAAGLTIAPGLPETEDLYGTLEIGGDTHLDRAIIVMDLGPVPGEELAVPGSTHDSLVVEGSITFVEGRVALSLPEDIVTLAAALDAQVDPNAPDVEFNAQLPEAMAIFANQAAEYLAPYAIIEASEILGCYEVESPAGLPSWLAFKVELLEDGGWQRLVVRLSPNYR
ncbi:MAG TPA: hypothetical protein PKC43_13115 [Phycisphaerales bacterium]|nr:hypothetical protein [Phycisphaerales bacterium]HMP38372.1 hypothetical protein [Phycisphaerales bacterium]